MPALTPVQARQLAQSYQAMSATLSRSRIESWSTLTPDQHAEIDLRIWSLLCAASDLVTQATTFDLSALNASDGAASLLKAADAAHKAMEASGNVLSALTLAATAIDLAAAIARGDVGEIAAILEGLATQTSPPAEPDGLPSFPEDGHR